MSCFTLVFAALLFGVYRFAAGRGLLLKKKNINVVILYLADVELGELVTMENIIGSVQVVPFLSSRGYEIENVFSMHHLAVANGGLARSLITAFDNDRDKDQARLLVITVIVQPGKEPHTLQTNFALMDSNLSELTVARKSGGPAKVTEFWRHEGKTIMAPPHVAAEAFHGQLDQALRLYDRQFK